MNPRIFPYALIFLDVCASIAYLAKGEPWRALYWIAAATISFASVKM